MASKNKFKWDVAALIPDTAVLPLPVLGTDGKPIMDGDKPAFEEVTFHELPRLKLKDFLVEQREKLMAVDLTKPIKVPDEDKPEAEWDTATDAQGNKLYQKRPVDEVQEASYAFLAKWCAEMTNGVKTVEDFNTLFDALGTGFTTSLVEMLIEVNHVNEILSTQGNLLWLPLASESLTE